MKHISFVILILITGCSVASPKCELDVVIFDSPDHPGKVVKVPWNDFQLNIENGCLEQELGQLSFDDIKVELEAGKPVFEANDRFSQIIFAPINDIGIVEIDVGY